MDDNALDQLNFEIKLLNNYSQAVKLLVNMVDTIEANGHLCLRANLENCNGIMRTGLVHLDCYGDGAMLSILKKYLIVAEYDFARQEDKVSKLLK